MLRNYRFTSSLRKYDHCLTIAPLTEHCESWKKEADLVLYLVNLISFGTGIACTQTLSYFSFRSFGEHRRAREWGEHASARKKKKNHPYPFALAVNKSPAVYLLSRALEGLWRENRGAVNKRVRTFSIQTVYLNKEKKIKNLVPRSTTYNEVRQF